MNTPSRLLVPLILKAGVLGSCDLTDSGDQPHHDAMSSATWEQVEGLAPNDPALMDLSPSEADPCEEIEAICDGVHTAYEASVLAQAVLELALFSEEEPFTLPFYPLESWLSSNSATYESATPIFRAPGLCDITGDDVPTGFTLYPMAHSPSSDYVEKPDLCLRPDRFCGEIFGAGLEPPHFYDSEWCFDDPTSGAYRHWEGVFNGRKELLRQVDRSVQRGVDRLRGGTTIDGPSIDVDLRDIGLTIGL